MTAAAETPRLTLVSENDEAQLLAANIQQALEVFDTFVKATRFNWYLLGDACITLKQHEGWRQAEPVQGKAAYHSWDDFVERKMQRGKSTVYRAVQLREELSVIAVEDAQRIPLVNAMQLMRLKKRLGESKWCSPKTIDAAIKMSEEKFEEFCNELLPGAAKQEKEVTLKIKMEASQYKRVTKAFKVFLWAADALEGDERDALEGLCADFMTSQCAVEGYTTRGMTNEEAYQRARGRRKKTK